MSANNGGIGQMRQTIFKDSNLSLFQQSVNDQFGQVSKIPFMNGNLLTDVELLIGQENIIDHKLGRKATGYFVTASDAGTVVWNSVFTDTTITLYVTINATVNLWVF